MASATISLLDLGSQQDFVPSKDEVGSIVIPLGKQHQLDSSLDSASLDGLAVVKRAWGATLWRVSNSTGPPDMSNVYVDHSVAVVQASVDPMDSPMTPPGTPCTITRSILKETLIVYVKPPPADQEYDPTQFPDDLGVLAAKSPVRLEIIQNACRWAMTISYLCVSVTMTQAENLMDIFLQELEDSLQYPTTSLPPSPPTEEAYNELDKFHPSACPKIERCIHDLIEEQVRAQPEQEAVCAHDGSLTFAELSVTSWGLSHKLAHLGAGPEERVAILMPKSRWYSVAVLAVLKAGAVFVPLDPNHPTARTQQLIQEINPCALITTSAFSPKAQALGCQNAVLIDQENATDDSISLPLMTPVKPSNAAYIIFTSGSTGKPKGVVVEHSALATSAVMRGAAVGLGPGSRVLQYAPHTFDVSVDEILTTWIHGGCVCVPSESDRFMIAQFMEATRVTVALLTPTSARTLCPDEVPTLQTLQTGGEVLAEDVNDKWSSRVTLFNVYGPTEASIACVMSNRTGIQGTGHVLGRAIGGSCWVVDPDDASHRKAPGEIGELVIAGPILARGYFGDPVRTEASFVHLKNSGVRIYKTGDLASMDSAGIISYHGRKDLEIKIRGQRINIAEVEHALLQSDAVHTVAVEYPRSGLCANKLTAILCLKSDIKDIKPCVSTAFCFEKAYGIGEDILTLLHSHVSSVLPTAMVPSKWLALPDLPQTTSTKVDRKQVRTWLEEMDEATYNRIFYSAETKTPVNPTTPLPSSPEESLVAVWSQVLKTDPHHLRLDQSFIRNGGDSIMAMEARHLAHDAGLIIDIRDLLIGRSLQDIARRASSVSASESTSLVGEDTDLPFELSPVQKMYFDHIDDPKLGLQQRVSIEMTQPVEAKVMQVALDSLIHSHPMLRARFILHEGRWMQHIPRDEYSNKAPSYGFYAEAPTLEDFCTEPMDIEKGPLFHAHLLHPADDKQTLVLCAHHLVVDFVSWRIILQDLHHALVTALDGLHSDSHPRPTLTFQQWCRQQQRHADSLDPDTVMPFPPGPVDLKFWQSPDSSAIVNTYSELKHQKFRLSSAQTARILDRFNNLPSIHPTDLLIGAFATAFQRIFPERETPNVFIEGHGREPWQPSLDVSRTVGWFTTAYPIHLPTKTIGELNAAIRAASERRRATPSNGHPYWTCRYLSSQGRARFADDQHHQQMEVVLNYAGAVIQRAPGLELFGDNVRTTEIGHPECPRFSLFDIVASIEQPQQELVIRYSFPKQIEHQDRIREMLEVQRDLLESVAKEDYGDLERPNQPFVTPTAHQCPADIASLIVDHMIDIDKDVEAIYPASSLQQHMLQRQSLEPWFYRVGGTWTVQGTTEDSSVVEGDRLLRAWHQVVQRYSTLRTIFRYSAQRQQFFAIVLRTVCPDAGYVREQKPHPLYQDTQNLVPPHRMLLQEMAGHQIECFLEFSHTIIDATSRSIVLQDLADAYEGKLQSRPLESSSFWAYVNQVQSGELCSALSIPSLSPAGKVASIPVQLTYPEALLSRACMEHEITMSSFFMSAWAIVLSQQLGGHSVAFDYVLSDRSANIPGIEAAVGLYLRLPTCQVMVAPDTPAAVLVRRIHDQRTQDLNSGLRLPSYQAAEQQLTTLVNIRNSGTDSIEMQSQTMRWTLKGFDDPWDYDLVLAVNLQGSRVLGCSIDYADGVVSASIASNFAQGLAIAVEMIVQDMGRMGEKLDGA